MYPIAKLDNVNIISKYLNNVKEKYILPIKHNEWRHTKKLVLCIIKGKFFRFFD